MDNLPLQELGLPARVENALRRGGIHNTGHLAELAELGEITSLHSLGKAGVVECHRALLHQGLPPERLLRSAPGAARLAHRIKHIFDPRFRFWAMLYGRIYIADLQPLSPHGQRVHQTGLRGTLTVPWLKPNSPRGLGAQLEDLADDLASSWTTVAMCAHSPREAFYALRLLMPRMNDTHLHLLLGHYCLNDGHASIEVFAANHDLNLRQANRLHSELLQILQEDLHNSLIGRVIERMSPRPNEVDWDEISHKLTKHQVLPKDGGNQLTRLLQTLPREGSPRRSTSDQPPASPRKQKGGNKVVTQATETDRKSAASIPDRVGE